MAKTKYTKEDIVAFVKDLDSRAKTLSPTKIDAIINRGYAELTTVSKTLFSNEEVLALTPYYEGKELKFSVDIDEDVTEVYDTYLTLEDGNTSKNRYSHEVIQGIGIFRNRDVAFRDNRYVGRVHVDLGVLKDVTFDNLVVKYYYTPKITSGDVYMSSQLYLAFQDAIWAALNYFMKDVEGEAQRRTSMYRTGKSTIHEPEDIVDSTRAVFGGL